MGCERTQALGCDNPALIPWHAYLVTSDVASQRLGATTAHERRVRRCGSRTNSAHHGPEPKACARCGGPIRRHGKPARKRHACSARSAPGSTRPALSSGSSWRSGGNLPRDEATEQLSPGPRVRRAHRQFAPRHPHPRVVDGARRRRPQPTGLGRRFADSERAQGRRAGRCGTPQQGCRAGAVRDRQDRRNPPRPRLHEARHHVPGRAPARASRPTEGGWLRFTRSTPPDVRMPRWNFRGVRSR